ncbi:metal-dependent hydrolase family protein [Acrocarpospora catenulata]|uniref:metal-dependent hydrolase family protein n=1 Tax=Acrocarpospora catenulata TaxID=2836182 RepID=UPI001BD94D7A|nr:amidohydrolase family protein [Acrocarpospora catenulata]
MTVTVLRGVQVLDVETGELNPRGNLVIEGERIADPAARTYDGDAEVFDFDGAVVMPGLFDCHVHLTAVSADLIGLTDESPQYATAYAIGTMREMLRKGFTTVRDVGGADFGLAQAVQDGLIPGPRVLFGGKAISQTGGHGDMRKRGRNVHDPHPCGAGIGMVCDGVDEVRRGVRSMLRTGADHIKIMVSGGVASPTDRIDSTQYSDEEISAAVAEAAAANRYVAAHAYDSKAINRAVRLGVRSIEHGNLLDESSPPVFREHGAYYVPTIIATTSYLDGEGINEVEPEVREKIEVVAYKGIEALRIAHEGGVQIAFGTDLLGAANKVQMKEFDLRARVQDPIDIIRSATQISARLVQRDHELGLIRRGYVADLLVLERDPRGDITAISATSPVAVFTRGRRAT